MHWGGPGFLLPFGILSPPSPEKAIASSQESVKVSDSAIDREIGGGARDGSAIPQGKRRPERFCVACEELGLEWERFERRLD